tara:strand:+ start:5621 stop:6436 length:816 start_codon:yes stop_codon:yes gene_type:complete
MALFKKYFLEFFKILNDIFLLLYFSTKKLLNDEDFLILTGSDSTHFNSLVNLLKTLIAYEPNTEVVIINLGMSKNEIQYLESNFNYQIKEFKFEEYPSFVSRRDDFDKLGAYAWKPISIYNEFNETEKNVIWLDAGCLITKELNLIKTIIRKNGFYSPQSSDNIERWTHEGTLRKLNVPTNLLKKRNISGGIVGFAKNSDKVKDLLNLWYQSCIDESTIAPKGSSRLNHRQDQAILSVIIHKLKISKYTPRTHLIFGILRHQDNEKEKYLQ